MSHTNTPIAPIAVSSPSSTITIEGKQFGRGRQLFPTWEMPLPGNPLTLRDFLSLIVYREVAAFKERQEQRQVLTALTTVQIAEGVAKGKVDMGGRPEALTGIEERAAVQNAIQAFEDGLYYVFLNDTQQEKLDEIIPLQEGSRVMFLRLTALAGG
jgi:hypothetical protein